MYLCMPYDFVSMSIDMSFVRAKKIKKIKAKYQQEEEEKNYK